MTPRPHSEACERNKEPILGVLKGWFTRPGTVLEIGSGTGQHAVHFAAALPHLTWTATDREENLEGIRQWFSDANLANLHGPLALDVQQRQWPVKQANYVFSANTAHIMSWPNVEAMFAGVGAVLEPDGRFLIYGPFNRNGQFTSESNREFDEMLKSRDPAMGIRDGVSENVRF